MIYRRVRMRAFAAGVITTLIVAISLVVAAPPLRAATAELLGIERADSNIIYTNDPVPDSGFAEFGDLLVAEHLTPYQLREPTALPENYRFAHGKHWPDRDMIELIYRRPHPTDSRRTELLSLRQWPAPAAGEPILEVGAGARVETVDVNGREGYYFSGAWRGSMPAASAGAEQERRLGWNEDGSAQRLRWRDGDVVLELSAGWGVLTRAQLIEIAASVAVVEE